MRLPRLVVLALFAAACAPKTDTIVPAEPVALSAAELDSVRAVTEAFGAAMNAGDTVALFATYAEDARVLPPDAPILQGAAARADLVGLIMAGASDFKLVPSVTYGIGDLAYGIGVATFKIGGVADSVKYLEVLRKGADGKWRYVADMFSGMVATPKK
jgi:ketosteroid isomerase-like protein